MASVIRRSYLKPGKLIPSNARRLKGRSIRLAPGGSVEWHSTRDREEIILVFRGSVSLETRDHPDRTRSIALSSGRAAFVSPHVWHRVVNRSRRQAHYIYVTA